MSFNELPIIELDVIDSTNNYAMRLIDADKALAGLTITATRQTEGKGQRGRKWVDEPGQCLLMSIILKPSFTLEQQFLFNATITLAIAKVLQNLLQNITVAIKWPNDIIVNDKKAGGILIENVIRGSNWVHSVLGLGLNIGQEHFGSDLPFATSLRIASGTKFDNIEVARLIRDKIMEETSKSEKEMSVVSEYNSFLYKRGRVQTFILNAEKVQAKIIGAQNNGTLQVAIENGDLVCWQHGQALWDYSDNS